jgi:hypothetical protein
MKPIDDMKQLIDLGERVVATIPQICNDRFGDAAELFLDSLIAEIHILVKENGLQQEYHDLSNDTIFESVADEWLERNPFNPETTSV